MTGNNLAPTSSKLSRRGSSICIDAGHGGKDSGARNRSGGTEAGIVLPVAYALRALLAAAGFRTFLTRTGDEYLTLGERTRIASENGADLFVSLHLNADPDDDSPGQPEARGEEVWFHKPEDRELAEWIGRGLRRIYPGEPFRGIMEGNLFVLRETSCPAALVELAFVDNSESYRRLSNELEQLEAATAVFNGLLRRQQEIEQGTDFEGGRVL